MSKLLTEKEILKQAENLDLYMNAAQLAFFKDLLNKLRAEAEEHVDSVRKELSAMERETDELDRAAQEDDRMVKLRIIERESKLIHKISESLRRIEEGDYGYCEETGEPIGIRRLLLRPTATLSVDAKSFQEEKEKQFADERDREN